MINTTNLKYQYASSPAIEFGDIQVSSNEACLLLGASGSGKTTLLHLLGGLLRKYSGQVKVNGQDLGGLSESELDKFRGKHMGFIFQRNHLIQALTVEKNLLLPSYLAGLAPDVDHVNELLHVLGLSEKKKSKIRELSQGQAQRVAIARAIVNRPTIILADEPTSALDDRNCDQVITLLLRMAEANNATLLVATHDQRLKRSVPRQILLSALPTPQLDKV